MTKSVESKADGGKTYHMLQIGSSFPATLLG